MPSARTFPVHTRDELLAMSAPTFLIDQIIAERSLVVLYGPPGAGKTFIAMDISLSICANQEWFGHETQPGPVIYITPEGLAGLKLRLQAWETHHQTKADQFGYVCDAPQFLEDKDVETLIQSIKQGPYPSPVLIVIDTLARHMVGGDENSALHMGECIDNVDQLRNTFNCAVIIVHHTGKATQSNYKERGSTALRGAADTMIAVEKGELGIAITCEKQKDSEPFPQMSAGLLQVALPEGGTSCVSIRNEIIIEPTGKLDAQKEKILLVLLPVEAEGLRTKEILVSTGIPEATYHRHRTSLVSDGLIEHTGQRYRLTAAGREKALNPLSQTSHESPQTLPSLSTPFRGGSGESGGKEVA